MLSRRLGLRWYGSLLAMIAVFASPLSAQVANELPLVPVPASARMGQGQFVIDESFAVVLEGYQEPRLDRARWRFLHQLFRQTGIPVDRGPARPTAKFVITTGAASAAVQELGEDESYQLEVTPDLVRLRAPNPLGVLHGMQSFLQLVHTSADGYMVPAVTIDDRPRFPWRGMLIDVSRHFIPLDVLKRNLDAMEAVKMNVLHWHLSDDQGFRVESRKFPLLQQKGSDGLYYTQDQIRDLVEYARDRGIRVVPEFDVPGHTTAWLVGYPELAAAPGPFEIGRHWGVFDPVMDPTRDSTYQFLDDFIGEVAELFPDRYFHIGGDEVNGREWNASPQIQQFMKEHGYKSDKDLQAYFTTRLQRIVERHGKIMEGWDEVLHPDIPKEVVIQSWRGQDSLAAAARQGNRGLLSFGYYLDLMHPASYHYAIDPMAKGAADLDAEQKQRILGGESCMWAEYISEENIEQRIWPRNGAIAERLWSPESVTDVPSLYRRLALLSRHLQSYGVQHLATYPRMLERMAGSPQPVALKRLGDTLEPVKAYQRSHARQYNQLVPLNRLVDAVPPESMAGRDFSDLVGRVVHKTATPDERAALRATLVSWRDNHTQLQPLLMNSDVLKELEPLSGNLAAIGQIGLQALDYIEKGSDVPASWRQQQYTALSELERPIAALVSVAAPAVKQLVGATGP